MACWREPCPDCPNRATRAYRAIGGDGPTPAPVLLIGERPGQDENKYGYPFVGKTGQELNDLYLPLSGMSRSNVRVCNTVLCGADGNKTPTDVDIARCAPHHIPQEIERTRPDLIFLLGGSACKLVPGIDLEIQHGIPQHTRKVGELYGWSGWLVPMYHPSRGLHESRWMKVAMDDWEDMRNLVPIDDPPDRPRDYRVLKGRDVLDAYISDTPAIDTERHGSCVFSVQCSSVDSTGFMVMADDHTGIGCLRHKLSQPQTPRQTQSQTPRVVSFHHAAHDLDELRLLEIPIPHFRDTMQESFHLGNLPQGLKALAYRLFRHRMVTWEDTVRPDSISALYSWMFEAREIARLDLTYREQRPRSVKLHKCDFEKLLDRLLSNTNTESEYDPWGKPDEPRLNAFWSDPLNEWMVTHVEARIGHYPILGIGNCSINRATRYAVGDSDETLQVAAEFARIRRRPDSFRIYDGDNDRYLYSG